MFVYIRHGQSKGNAEKYIAEASTELTEFGKTQARESALLLKQYAFSTCLVSELKRAQQTAEIILEELHINPTLIVDGNLNERTLGNEEGKAKLYDSIHYYTSNSNKTYESTTQLFDRVNRFYNSLRKLNDNTDILISGHSIFGLYLQNITKGVKTLDNIDYSLRIPNVGNFIFDIH